MDNKLREDSTKLLTRLNKHKTDRSNQENNNKMEFDAYLYDSETNTKLTIFGHAFSMAELNSISIFASKLKSIATKTLTAGPKIPEGAIFIMKVNNNEVEISFGGLSKKQ